VAKRSENTIPEPVEVEGAPAASGANLDEIAGAVLDLMGRAVQAKEEAAVPSIPADGIILTIKPNLTFAGIVWPVGSIIDLETDQDKLESDDHQNAFLRAVRAGEKWTKDLALWMPKTDENFAEADRMGYQAHLEWVKGLNDAVGMDKFDQLVSEAGAEQRRGEIGVKIGDVDPGKISVQVVKYPERIVSVGGRLDGDDQ
jgi:hypothetical protein